MDAPPIPLPLTSLVGREREIAQVTDLLRSGGVRLLTLTGPGGVGKTRLALQVAANLHGRFSEGAYFVSLAPVGNPDLVLSTIAQTLGVHESPGQPLFDSLCAALRGRRLLLTLDNFEQVVDAGARVLDLLLCAPGLQALVTSRTVLRVYGEQDYPLSPLTLPDAGQQATVEQLTQYEAVRLFIERARAVQPSFAVNNSNAPAVAEICRRLDGLPLAIELAAARVKLMSPQALLKRLDRTLPFLTHGAATLPRRHQTLRDAITWSYDLLPEDEKRLFRSLSVFVGGCTLEAAEAICRTSSAEGIMDGLTALIDKSLLRQIDQEDGEPRFLMLETIRELAMEQLVSAGEEQAIGKLHTKFFLALAERAEPELMGANQAAWLDRLATDYDNLRAVFSRAQLAGDVETGLRLGWALYHFWYIRGYLSEGRKWLSEAVEQGGEAPKYIQAKALNSLGNLSSIQGDYKAGRYYHEQALALWRELEYKPGIAAILGNLGNTAWQQGDYAGAKALREQSIALYRQLGPEWAVAVANGLHNLGVLMWAQGEHEEAHRFCEEVLPLQRELGDTRGIANTLYSMGLIAAAEGDLPGSRAYQEESLALSRELGDKVGIASSLYALGEIAAEQGDYPTAHALHSDSLRMRYELGTKRGVADCLLALAVVAKDKSEPRRLVRLCAAAEALFSAIGATITPQERKRYERWLAFARERLGPEAFTTTWEEKALTLEEAVTLALEEPVTQTLGAPTAAHTTVAATPSSIERSIARAGSDLTRREIEVLRLVAAGLTNPEIAEHLSLSVFTVQTHLRSIFSKIDVKTRVAAVRYVFEHNLG